MRTSAKLSSQIVGKELVDAGPFKAQVYLLQNGTMKVRSLAPTRKLRRQHEKVMKKIIFKNRDGGM